MKIKNKFTGLILCLALSAASLTGCGGEKASEPVRSEAVQDTAKTDKKADTDKKETKAEKKNDKKNNRFKVDRSGPGDTGNFTDDIWDSSGRNGSGLYKSNQYLYGVYRNWIIKREKLMIGHATAFRHCGRLLPTVMYQGL